MPLNGPAPVQARADLNAAHIALRAALESGIAQLQPIAESPPSWGGVVMPSARDRIAALPFSALVDRFCSLLRARQPQPVADEHVSAVRRHVLDVGDLADKLRRGGGADAVHVAKIAADAQTVLTPTVRALSEGQLFSRTPLGMQLGAQRGEQPYP